ncbi:iron-containing alcohol dehydrogenase [Inquilinus limosus]|uniref:Alcohol dehydrogenase n=1 Tax=Inquilinus limosus TaxID=171674 RepID=A0A211ZVF3_9PROT|nr:iron-containing alcohol dehydrogenase [Inquilinus limosus]OWJ69250.1 alcohol dehydrogenase [Inquilinus limosus]
MNRLTCLPQEAVVWGGDVLAGTLARLGEHGFERPIVFTVGALEEMERRLVRPHLQGSVGSLSAFEAHAPDTSIRRGLQACIDAGAGSIVAYGGGSVLDAAKAVSHLHHQRTGRFLPIAALPTTLSGSEFSHYFGITETSGPQRFKRSYAVRETVPRVVVLDPVLLTGTPRSLLLSSTIKGIDHAVEGMRRVAADHPHAIMAARGVQRFFAILERWPETLEVREALESGAVTMGDLLGLQLSAWHCYFFPASVIYGLSHRIGHVLGGTFGLPHSLTSCITLAPVIRACARLYGDRLGLFAPGASTGEAPALLADRIARLVATLGLPDRIGLFNLDRARLPEVATLLKQSYPNEVGDLGTNAESRLDRLLEELW